METNRNESAKERVQPETPSLSAFTNATVHAGEMLYLTTSSPQISRTILHLQSIGQSLVHLGDLGGNAKVDGAVANLDNESTNKVGVDLIFKSVAVLISSRI